MQYKHFNRIDRDRLQEMLANSISVSEISKRLGKHPASIYREIGRNQHEENYSGAVACEIAALRRRLTKPKPKLDNIDFMRGEVRDRLFQRHSPEQISGRLKKDFPDDHTKHVSTETIYVFIYKEITAGKREYRKLLRHKRGKRRNRLQHNEKRGVIPGRTMIDKRPEYVDLKQEIGHWEGDTVEGAKKTGYMVTITERKTKYLLSYPIPNKTVENVNYAIALLFRRIPAKYKKTLTVDNGKEFSGHKALASKIRMDIYFAHPYHSWERGLNEHTNGLLRQYFPKGQELDNLHPSKLARVEKQINNRPRKCLDYQTPYEVLWAEKIALQI